jgi:mono/diheme cytochrome c family protein
MRHHAVVWRPRLSVVLLVLSAAVPFGAAAGDTQPGRQLYLQYCSACHGPEAKGDGLAGTLMQPHPADLTRLASRNNGEFPMERVVRTIDGREALRAHGEPVMPVWGEVLSDGHGDKGEQRPAIERRVQGRIFSIAEYLRTIQEK